MPSKTAVQFGAGSIGRGFIGQLLCESGYETVFVDVNPKVVCLLNAEREYPLRLVGPDSATVELKIGPVSCLASDETRRIAQSLAVAELAGTSVGANCLKMIAPALAEGIRLRARTNPLPLNILLCENEPDARRALMSDLQTVLTGDDTALMFLRYRVGLVETVIGRMVPRQSPATLAVSPLLVVAEPYKHLPCRRSSIVGDIPQLALMSAVEDFEAHRACKLFIHNMGHAAAAYFGYPGHTYIWQCVEDPQIRLNTEAAMRESAMAIERAFPESALKPWEIVDDLLYRFSNRALGDTVERVAADPMRKLRRQDRIIGAAELCVANSVMPVAICHVINAALAYNNPVDASAEQLQHRLATSGRSGFLEEHCGVAADSLVARLANTATNQ